MGGQYFAQVEQARSLAVALEAENARLLTVLQDVIDLCDEHPLDERLAAIRLAVRLALRGTADA